MNGMTNDIEQIRAKLNDNEQKRVRLSSIKNMDIKDLKKRQKQLTKHMEQLVATRNELNDLNMEYRDLVNKAGMMEQSLKQLRDANQQYLKTMEEIGP